MNRKIILLAGAAVAVSLSLGVPSMAQEKKQEEKKKAEKAAGDVGLLDTEKNYMILVTKEGKLITLDFDAKTKVTALESKDVKMGEIGLGSSATVEYVTKEDKAVESKVKELEDQISRLKAEQKRIVTKMEFRPAKGE